MDLKVRSSSCQPSALFLARSNLAQSLWLCAAFAISTKTKRSTCWLLYTAAEPRFRAFFRAEAATKNMTFDVIGLLIYWFLGSLRLLCLFSFPKPWLICPQRPWSASWSSKETSYPKRPTTFNRTPNWRSIKTWRSPSSRSCDRWHATLPVRGFKHAASRLVEPGLSSNNCVLRQRRAVRIRASTPKQRQIKNLTSISNLPEFVSIFCCFICKQRLIAVVTECGVVCDWIYSSGAHVVDKVSCNKLLPVSISIVWNCKSIRHASKLSHWSACLRALVS